MELLDNLSRLSGFLQRGSASVLVGGQFGSEAKGLAAAEIAYHATVDDSHLICTTNAGAQAGHTTILPDGSKFVCFHLPTMGVIRKGARIYLNAGCIIDPLLLATEIEQVAAATGEGVDDLVRRITIHPNAAVITDEAKLVEKNGATTHLGSTQKGIGAALANKIMRRPGATAGTSDQLGRFKIEAWSLPDLMGRHGKAVMVEIPQGTSLSINNSPFFPKCTSRDCWVGQGLTDAGIHPKFLHRTMMVVRTFPIRVGHIYDAEGNQIGDSGPFYDDGEEIGWEDLPGVTPEITTVTKRVRRVAYWSDQQYRDALLLNQPTDLMLTFVNYLQNEASLDRQITRMEEAECDTGVYPSKVYSWGPKVGQSGYSTTARNVLLQRRQGF